MNLGFGLCTHKHLYDMGYCGSLPRITGIDVKLYEAFCWDCEEMVYARTEEGKVVVSWNTDRNKTFTYTTYNPKDR